MLICQYADLCSLSVSWPIGWLDTAPIDKVGFMPDVKIPETEKDWVGFVHEYLKK